MRKKAWQDWLHQSNCFILVSHSVAYYSVSFPPIANTQYCSLLGALIPLQQYLGCWKRLGFQRRAWGKSSVSGNQYSEHSIIYVAGMSVPGFVLWPIQLLFIPPLSSLVYVCVCECVSVLMQIETPDEVLTFWPFRLADCFVTFQLKLQGMTYDQLNISHFQPRAMGHDHDKTAGIKTDTS